MKEFFNYRTDRSFALEMDHSDPLAPYRNDFHIPNQPDGIYFCGNSLGLQPKTARAYVEQELKDWEHLGVKGHFEAVSPWLPYHECLTEQTARLVGAKPNEVVVMNTLTVNLHLLMVSFYRPSANRHKVLIESPAFPSDRYAVESQIRFHGYDPAMALREISPRPKEHILRTEDIGTLIEKEGKDIALVLFSGVNYYTGQAFDMPEIVRLAHTYGCLVGFDLAHAVGNLPLSLHNWEVDFAVWCSYKYLNGGPGCIGGCFVHENHAKRNDLPRFTGWWGHDKETRFTMPSDFKAIPGAEGWQLSNPPILSMAALRASMDIFDDVGMAALREKSKQLSGYLFFLLTQTSHHAYSILTPADPAQRGCQLSIKIQDTGKQVYDQLTTAGIVCDWRQPDVIRVAPVPLYNRFIEVYEFATRLADCL